MTPANILISIPNWVGDVVMATPALRAVRRAFPRSRIVHLMRPYVAEVLRGLDFADEQRFWPHEKGLTGWKATVSLARRLHGERFDLALLLTNSFRSALVIRASCARRRVGYGRDGRSWLLTDRLHPARKNGRYAPTPALDYYNALARHIGCADVTDRLELAVTAEEETVVDRRLGATVPGQPLIVLNPGANYGSAKCWPAEHYAALADELVDRYGARVVASLAPAERAIADRLLKAARHPIEVFVDPPLGLGPLKALIRRAALLITNDTGPRHFAAALGTPVITIFGSSDPAWTDTRYARERIAMLRLDCQPCMKRVCPLGHHDCMNHLRPDQVMSLTAEFLPGPVDAPSRPDQRSTQAIRT
jgi:heptosyltransferase-2